MQLIKICFTAIRFKKLEQFAAKLIKLSVESQSEIRMKITIKKIFYINQLQQEIFLARKIQIFRNLKTKTLYIKSYVCCSVSVCRLPHVSVYMNFS